MEEFTHKEIERLKRRYPAGTKVRCIEMKDNCHPVPRGTLGTVKYVDDAGTIHVGWDNGSSLGLVPYEDTFTRFRAKEHSR